MQNLDEKCGKVQIKSICCAKYQYKREIYQVKVMIFFPLEIQTAQIKMPNCKMPAFPRLASTDVFDTEIYPEIN